MNHAILDNVNNLVKPGDELYILGDFAFTRGKDWAEQITFFRDMVLCPNVHLVCGNHDPKRYKDRKFLQRIFSSVSDLKQVYIYPSKANGKKIPVILCHYAMRVWPASHYGSLHLYGHSHHSLPDDPYSLSFDVGVNGWDYKPLNEDDIYDVMSKKIWKPKDHHVGTSKLTNTEYKEKLERELYERLRTKFENN